jgi:hypothetical protein
MPSWLWPFACPALLHHQRWAPQAPTVRTNLWTPAKPPAFEPGFRRMLLEIKAVEVIIARRHGDFVRDNKPGLPPTLGKVYFWAYRIDFRQFDCRPFFAFFFLLYARDDPRSRAAAAISPLPAGHSVSYPPASRPPRRLAELDESPESLSVALTLSDKATSELTADYM